MAEFTVAASVARGLTDFAVARGAPEADMLRRAGIDHAALEDLDGRVGSDRYIALMRAAQALTGDPALALHFAEDINLDRMSIVGMLGQASTSLANAFQQVQRYGQLVTDAGPSRFTMERRNGQLWTVDHRSNPNAFPELTETTFGFMVCSSRTVGPSVWLKELHVTHPAPSYAAEYERVFQVPVRFGADWNAIRSDESLMHVPFNLQPRYAFGIFSKHADALLADLQASRTTRGRVEAELMPILHTGETGLDAIAARLGLSRATLHRRLKGEGVTYGGVVDDLRRRLALDYLGARKVSVNETAYLVGFSDPAAFSRAFKRWTGTSPRNVRLKGLA